MLQEGESKAKRTPFDYLAEGVEESNKEGGDRERAKQHLREGIAHFTEDENPQTGSELHIQLARLISRDALEATTPHQRQELLSQAEEIATRGIVIAEGAGDPHLLPIPLTFRGDLQVRQGNYKDAVETYTQALSHPLPANQSETFRLVIQGKRALAAFHLPNADSSVLTEAENLADQIAKDSDSTADSRSRAIWETGIRIGIAEAISDTASFTEVGRAQRLLVEAKEVCTRLNLEDRLRDVQRAEQKLLDTEFSHAQTLRNAGQIDEAITAYEQVIQDAHQSSPLIAAHATHMIGVAEYQREKRDFDRISKQYDEAQRLFTEVDDKVGQVAVLRDRARLAAAQNNREEALALLEESIDLAKQIDNPEHEAMSRAVLARFQAENGDIQTAQETIQEARTVGDSVDHPTYFQAHIRLYEARIYFQAGNYSEALETITDAESILSAVETENDGVKFEEDRRKLAELRQQITDKTTESQ